MSRTPKISVLAILSILGMELFALSRGIDGIALGVSIAAVAGLGGYHLRKSKEGAQ